MEESYRPLAGVSCIGKAAQTVSIVFVQLSQNASHARKV